MSQVDVCNMALAHLGHADGIVDITEDSPQARACKIFYDLALKSTLRGANWPFAKRIVAPALVEEDPNTLWKFSYRQPATCLKVRRVVSGYKVDTQETRIPFEPGNDNSGTLIFTDRQEAEIEYTHYVQNTDHMPDDFILALSYKLASLIGPSIMSGDDFKLARAALELWKMHLNRAEATAMSEEQGHIQPEAESIRARY